MQHHGLFPDKTVKACDMERCMVLGKVVLGIYDFMSNSTNVRRRTPTN